MKDQDALTDHELYRITITGLSRSLEMLENLVLRHVDSTDLFSDQDRDLLNRVKERKNTGAHPIAIYLRPTDEPPKR